MGTYELKNKCPHCSEKRAIYEEWVDGALKLYYVGCDNQKCDGYHIDYPYNAAIVRLDMLVARHGGLRQDTRTQSALQTLSKGVWSHRPTRAGKLAECALCHKPSDNRHMDDCPVQVAREILGEFDGQQSA